jgi:hypothetical protein
LFAGQVELHHLATSDLAIHRYMRTRRETSPYRSTLNVSLCNQLSTRHVLCSDELTIFILVPRGFRQQRLFTQSRAA